VSCGYLGTKTQIGLFWPSLVSLAILYGAVYLGAYGWEITQPSVAWLGSMGSPVIIWTMLLLVYCFFASVLPVWLLLQPRDYINSHQLMVALVLLVGGLAVAGLRDGASLASAPAIATNIPTDAPPIWPFLFITIACGACSGFHCLVSSGTTSKQLDRETDAQYVAYGSMLLEGALAVLVILACTAGVGMGAFELASDGVAYVPRLDANGEPLVGAAAWTARYNPAGDWDKF